MSIILKAIIVIRVEGVTLFKVFFFKKDGSKVQGRIWNIIFVLMTAARLSSGVLS